MPLRRPRPRLLAATLVLVALAAAAWAPAAGAQVDPPTLRLIAPESHVTVERSGRYVYLDKGVWVAAVGGDFELRVARPDYATPLAVVQADSATGDVLRTFPDDVLEPWLAQGLSRFFRVIVRDAKGRAVFSTFQSFCPNNWSRERVDDSGTALPSYPTVCGFSPFTKSVVWGIPAGWAARGLGGETGGLVFPLRRDGGYTVTVRIAGPYADLLGIPRADALARFTVKVKTVKRRRGGGAKEVIAAVAGARPAGPASLAATGLDPDPATLPDLVALPPWQLWAHARKKRDYLSFAATIWNAGPAPLVVEGFRRRGEPVMDAYQYFTDSSGATTGRAPVGDLTFHPHRLHNHWHFLQLATFTLQDADDLTVVRSRKQAFCLAPTDPIDLLVERASWLPTTELGFSSCGAPDSLWVREVLQTGWGDTYQQYIPGQAFDITKVPNGWYYAKVTVNPLGSLYETDLTNNTESRLVRLGGRPGNRWARAAPWNGIED